MTNDYFNYTEKYKKEYGEKTIVFLQCGAFYEIYGLKDPKTEKITGSDIKEFSKINECIIVNKNGCVREQNLVMAGFKDSQIEKNLRKMQNEGYTIVVISQDEQCKNTTRSLSGIYSPGTFFGNDEEITNNIMCLWIEKYKITENKIVIGLSCIDIYTGQSFLKELTENYFRNPTTYDELEKLISIYKPSEMIIITKKLNDSEIDEIIRFSNITSKTIHKINLDEKTEKTKKVIKCESQMYQREVFNQFWDINDINTFFESGMFNEYIVATESITYLLNFIYSHNQNLVKKIKEPSFKNSTNRLTLANHSLKQLNIIGGDKRKIANISNFINSTITTMGNRKMKYIICNPITNENELNDIYNITENILNKKKLVEETRQKLLEISDLEKIFRKLILMKITPTDLVKISKSIEILRELEKVFKKNKLDKYFFEKSFNKKYNELENVINETINLEEALNIDVLQFDDNFFNENIYEKIDKTEKELNNDLDELKNIQKYLSEIISEGEKQKKDDYVKLNKTDQSGYYLFVTSRRGKILKDKISKNQDYSEFKDITLSKATSQGDKINNGKIDSLCKKILRNQNILKSLIKDSYNDFCRELINYQEHFEYVIESFIKIDTNIARAYIANKNNYVKPIIDMNNSKSFIDAKDLRHVLIEHINENELYVTNDIELGEDNKKNGIVLFGTNAVGKSSLIKSIGIAIIMAQSGFYVPCSYFRYKPYNYLFTRILGNDDIHKGLSTFAVEMSELRTILRIGNKNSLILGDELCSGTETPSAISIFSAGLITLDKMESTFLFATHFHEILDIKEVTELNKVDIMHMEVKYDKENDLMIYDRKLKKGAGQKMYGLEVCKSLNLPDEFLDLANNIRLSRNKGDISLIDQKTSKYNSKKIKGKCELCGKDGNDIHHLQYQKDANEKGFIKSFHKNHKANLINICNKCHDDIHENNKKYKKTKTNEGYKIMEIE